MFTRKSRFYGKKPLTLLLSFAIAVGYPAAFVPQTAKAATSAPAIAASGGKTVYVVEGGETAVDAGISLDKNVLASYPDNLNGATVVIEGHKSGDKLNFTTQSGITGKYVSTNGVLTLTGLASAEEYEAALKSVTFSTTSVDLSDRVIRFTLGSALAFGENGHFYEYINNGSNITWLDAKGKAAQKTYFGRQGYLVTITSASENTFVKEKTVGLGWLGAIDIERWNGEPKQTGDWRWVTGPEGLEDSGRGLKFYQGYVGGTAVAGRYINWASGEPNNTSNIEYVAHIYPNGTWNDFPISNNVIGYIVEYGDMPGDETFGLSATKTVSIVNKADLKKAVEAAGQWQEADYTASSWQEFVAAKTKAEQVLAEGTSSQQAVDDAREALRQAIDGLTLKKPTKASLDSVAKTITIPFDYAVALTAADVKGGFTIKIDGQDQAIDISHIEFDPAQKAIKITLPNTVALNSDSKVTVDYQNTNENVKGPFGKAVGNFKVVAEDSFAASLAISKPSPTATVAKPEIEGTVEPGSAVNVVIKDSKGNPVPGAGGTATVDVYGKWNFTPSVNLPDGNYIIEATAVKNNRTVTKTKNMNVDLSAPALTITEPSGSRVTVAKPEFKGTADAGSTVTVAIKDKNGNVVGTPTVTMNAYGVWSFTPDHELADGDYTFEVTATKDGKSTQVTKTVTVAATTNDSKLAGLQLNSWNGTPIGLSPAFNGSTTKYTASVTNSVYSVTLSSLPLDPNAKIEVSVNNGPWQQGSSGAASGNLPLNVGTNTIVVKVTDAKGNVTEYTLTITRESSDSGDSDSSSGGSTTTPSTSTGSSSSGGSTTPNGSGIETSVNGKDDAFATGKESTSGDRKVTSVQVDLDKLNKALSQGNGQKLAIHSSKDGDMKVDGLTAGAVKQLTDKGSSLEISNPLAIYPVPGGKMDLSAVSKQLGNAALGDIAVHIDIARSSDTLINNAKNKAAAEGYELLVTPVDLDMTFSHDGKMVRAGQLNGYAAKYIALPEGIDPNRITTGVIVNPDGSVFHVPTVVTKINSRYYALIKDLRSNGSYSVIWNPQDFDDVKNHWGKADVNNIAARLDLAGTGNNTFSPDRNVTRSEFSEIVVTGLGLKRQNAPQNKFPDVSDSAWYRSSVAIANEFDIVRGYEDGNFYGDRQITREQGMAMIARAYKLIETKAILSQEQTDALLAKYEDAQKVSAWAREDIALMIEAGIVQGNGPQLLSPQSNMTRAEVTALIARLLKTTNLIDK
ncbi:S-layer homology domain-containing protein [Paenibacillus elgii]